MIKHEFAEFVLNMRIAAGLSQSELAQKMNFKTDKSIRDIESGRILPEDVHAFEHDLRHIIKNTIQTVRGKAI